MPLYRALAFSVLLSLFVTAGAALAALWCKPVTWLQLGFLGALFGVLYLAAVYSFILTGEEREICRGLATRFGIAT